MNARLTNSPTFIALTLSAAFFFLAALFARHASWRDPGSLFFDPSHAYDFQYSNVRLRQAYEYLAEAANSPFHRSAHQIQPAICVGVASIARDNARYLRTTVASLLEGLTQAERDQIHMMVFIAETNATAHPAYQEKWLENSVDQVLLYDLSPERLDHFRNLEDNHALVSEKMLFDYMYLMKACYKTEAPYIALFEDDVLAMDGWYHRTRDGLEEAELKTAAVRTPGDYLYLRLFHTEEFLGWNSEDLPTHIFWSLAIIAVVGGAMIGARSFYPKTQVYLTTKVILAVCGVYIPLLIILFFASGRVTTMPLAKGVNKMNNYGCCAQGLAYPRHKAEDLIHWYDSAPRIGLRDTLIEQYADGKDELRWALTPSVIQHIGRTTSKVATGGRPKKAEIPMTQKLWSFPFELNDAEALRREHAKAVGKVP